MHANYIAPRIVAALFLAAGLEIYAAKAEFQRTKPHVNVANVDQLVPHGASSLHADVGDLRAASASDEKTPSPLWFSFHYAPQTVLVHGTDLALGFAAAAEVRRDRSANGRVTLDLRDGKPPISFEPRFGAVVPTTETGPGYIIILMALSGAPLRFDNFAVATVRPDPQLPGCDIWDFQSNGVGRSGARLHLSFHAEGRIEFARGSTN
jgi:hypothetical protein